MLDNARRGRCRGFRVETMIDEEYGICAERIEQRVLLRGSLGRIKQHCI